MHTRNEMNSSNNLKSDQSMFSYSQTLEFYRMCVIVVGNVVQHEWPILMRGAFFCGGGNFCGVLGFFMRYCFFPRDTPLTQQAVNCNEWSLIIAPLDPVSLYRKEIKNFFEDYGRLYFFIERRWWVLQGGVSFWHTMILLLLFVT